MRELTDQNFSALLGQIYEAPMQEGGWRSVLATLPQFAQTNVLSFVELEHAPGLALPWVPMNIATHGLSPAGEHALMNEWANRIPITPDLIGLTLRRGQAVATTDDTSPDFDFGNSAFCHECALPNDFYYMLGVSAFSQDQRSLFILSLNRPKRHGSFGNDEGKLMQELLPHLLRAHRIGQTLRELKLAQGVHETALAHSPTPVLGLTERGHVLYANAAAEALLQSAQGLRVWNGELQAKLPAEQQALSQALHRLGLLGGDVTGQAGDHLTFSRTGGPPLVGVLLPAPRSEGQRSFVMLLKDPTSQQVPPDALLQQLYRLTPAESRVATLLAQGLSIEQITEQVGTTAHTVRNQLKQVFAKTETSRQGELIRLVMNLT